MGGGVVDLAGGRFQHDGGKGGRRVNYFSSNREDSTRTALLKREADIR